MTIRLVVYDDKGLIADEWEGYSVKDYPDEEWLKEAFEEASEDQDSKGE